MPNDLPSLPKNWSAFGQSEKAVREPNPQASMGNPSCESYCNADSSVEPAELISYGCELRSLGQRPEAIRQFELALNESRRCNDPGLGACACNNLAVMYRDSGELELAARYQQQSFVAELTSDGSAQSNPDLTSDLSNLANDALLRGDLRTALSLAFSATRVNAGQQANLADRAADWGTLGLVYLLGRRWAEAVRCFRTSLRIHRRLNDVRGIGCNMLHLGQVCAATGDWRRAERWVTWGVRMLRSLPRGELHFEAELLWKQVRAHRRVAECDPSRN